MLTLTQFGLILDGLGAFMLALDVFGMKHLVELSEWFKYRFGDMSDISRQDYANTFSNDYVVLAFSHSVVYGTAFIYLTFRLVMLGIIPALHSLSILTLLYILIKLIIFLLVKYYFNLSPSFCEVIVPFKKARYSVSQFIIMTVITVVAGSLIGLIKLILFLEQFTEKGQGLRAIGLILLLVGFSFQFIGSLNH